MASDMGMMVSSTFNARIEPGLEAPQTSDGTWWYRHDGQALGPVSEETIQNLIGQKVVDRSTQVWRHEYGQDWKRLDQTSLWHEAASQPPAFKPTISARWQKIFDRFEADEAHPELKASGFSDKLKHIWENVSLPGLFLGPIYYCYLGLWRKAIWLCALVPVFSLIQEFTSKLSVLNSFISIYCATKAKEDFYKKKIKGESVWPELSFSRSAWTDIGIAAGVFILCVGSFALLSDGSSSGGDANAPRRQAAGTSKTAHARRKLGTSDEVVTTVKANDSRDANVEAHAPSTPISHDSTLPVIHMQPRNWVTEQNVDPITGMIHYSAALSSSSGNSEGVLLLKCDGQDEWNVLSITRLNQGSASTLDNLFFKIRIGSGEVADGFGVKVLEQGGFSNFQLENAYSKLLHDNEPVYIKFSDSKADHVIGFEGIGTADALAPLGNCHG